MMKKIISFCLIFFTFSCGTNQSAKDPLIKLGASFSITELDEKLTEDEVQTVSEICKAVEDKENYFNKLYLNEPIKLKYLLQEKKCHETKSDEKFIMASVEKNNSQLELVANSLSLMKDLLMPYSVMVKNLCSNLKNKMNYRNIRIENEIYSYSFFSEKSNQCQIDGDEVCMYIEKSKQVDKLTYRIYQIEAYKVSLNASQNFRGMILERAKVDKESCTNEGEVHSKEQFFMGHH